MATTKTYTIELMRRPVDADDTAGYAYLPAGVTLQQAGQAIRIAPVDSVEAPLAEARADDDVQGHLLPILFLCAGYGAVRLVQNNL